jgi:hypothetical protein
MRRKRPAPADDVSAAFMECCTALNQLTPKAREMVAGWLHQRYAAQLEEDMHIAEDEAQPERDAEYVARISRRET